MLESSITESPVKIDLNKPFTAQDVQSLIGSVPDDRHWQLVITYSGIAYLCDRDQVSNRQPPPFHEYPEGVEIRDPQLADDYKREVERDETLLAERSNLIFITFETYCHGNGYVGLEAADDEDWVGKVYRGLRSHWPSSAGAITHIDF